MTQSPKTLGEKIKAKREAQNLSQEELAEKLHISRQSVSKWETDLSTPTGKNRRLLNEILELNPDDYPNITVKQRLTLGQKLFMASGWLAAILIVIIALSVTLGYSTPEHDLLMKIQAAEGEEAYSTSLDGSDIKSAKYHSAADDSYAINIKFNTKSEKLLQKFTVDNIGHEVAIYIDGELQESCVINEPIKDGQLEISGLDAETAETLTEYINASIYQEQ